MSITTIEWTDRTWNPIRGCSRVSPGCVNCYAERQALRFAGERHVRDSVDPGAQTWHWEPGPFAGFVTKVNGHAAWTGKVELIESKLREPLTWRKPCKCFVNSMSDLFHESLPDEAIDRVFAVMALCPHITFQALTKRAARMRDYASSHDTPFRIAKQIDVMSVAEEMRAVKEETRPISDYPGYLISNTGKVFSSNGSSTCVHCGDPVEGIASKRYCSKRCRQNAGYHQTKMGRPSRHLPQLAEMECDIGEQGHRRAWLYKDGQQFRELIHRLVLATFGRPASGDEQGCHRDGNAGNNHIANLRWGTQEDNWEDRKRHGNAHSYGARHTVSPPLEWPLPNCWTGVSVESRAYLDRIDVLRRTPAAVRFVSLEPLLEDLGEINLKVIDWAIIGGESGPGARPFDVQWPMDIVPQCRRDGAAPFVKQLGADPWWSGDGDHGPNAGNRLFLNDSHGGDPSEWPEPFPREFPRGTTAESTVAAQGRVAKP